MHYVLNRHHVSALLQSSVPFSIKHRNVYYFEFQPDIADHNGTTVDKFVVVVPDGDDKYYFVSAVNFRSVCAQQKTPTSFKATSLV